MQEQFSRTERLIGAEALARLSRAHVAVFGVGGVGGYAVEALARTGVGELTLVDSDAVSPSNLNRQIIALHSSLGRPKVEVAKERVLDINPSATVHTHEVFYLPETADRFDFSHYDYVVDAIDTLSGKIELALRAKAAGVPIICSMGAGNKWDPTAFEIADIYETSVCPLAKAMRGICRKNGIDKLTVVYSKEPPMAAASGERSPASVIFPPAAAGLAIAAKVIGDLIQ
ncbi:MAG: tRNA threonylcarbamoyladenosine dehydratase [Clostridia bacterium]|nr:tRNA threonylcarbamoyladenosine dehydratase [Clostridia bacterium]